MSKKNTQVGGDTAKKGKKKEHKLKQLTRRFYKNALLGKQVYDDMGMSPLSGRKLGRSDSILIERKKSHKSHKYDTLLKWKKSAKSILCIKKIGDLECTSDLCNVIDFLIHEETETTYKIFVEDATHKELAEFAKSSTHKLRKIANKIIFESDGAVQAVTEMDTIGQGMDVSIVLGGDGTLLYLVSLFANHQTVPPIICFQRGSLGFLAPFQMKNYKQVIRKILNPKETQSICIRMRLTARIWRDPDNFSPEQHMETADSMNFSKDWTLRKAKAPMIEENHSDPTNKTSNYTPAKPPRRPSQSKSLGRLHDITQAINEETTMEKVISACSTEDGTTIGSQEEKDLNKNQENNFRIERDTDILFTKTQNIFPSHHCNDIIRHALNEVLIHRDNNASMMQGILWIDGEQCTTIQADGMIFSTPTGSTAYNISAGGSLISPTVPCIALTPICPHTLSFRPVVVPDETVLHVQIPKNARYAASVSFDGRNHITLNKGDVVEIIKCPYPVPTFKSAKFNVEWFQGLVNKFNWNTRELQKPHNYQDGDDDDQKKN